MGFFFSQNNFDLAVLQNQDRFYESTDTNGLDNYQLT